MSETQREYEVFRGLLNGEQVGTLDSGLVIPAVQKRSQALLGSDAHYYYVLHDGCDIRKPNSKEMEYLGDVLSLSKQVIPGYKTFNSVVVSSDNQSVELIHHELYSNVMPTYIGEEVLKDEKLKLELSAEKLQLIAEKSYINGKVILFRGLKKSSDLLKELNPDNRVCHVLDREYDGQDIFEEIADNLKDDFIIRIKTNRNSHLTYAKPSKPRKPCKSGKPRKLGKVSKQVGHYKLVNKAFKNQSSYQIEKITIKGKVYTNVVVSIEWEEVKIGEKSYNVVRIMLKKDDKPLFLQPMLLITNKVIENAEHAKQVYMGYLLRSKIEVVFKFLKQNLGWEAFQVRDFNSIKNLLAIAFFLAGFFEELKEHLIEEPIAIQICKLARSKGKVTLHFILNGMEKIAHFQEVANWIKKEAITQEQINEILAMTKTQNFKT
jgi:hypothetical protein